MEVKDWASIYPFIVRFHYWFEAVSQRHGFSRFSCYSKCLQYVNYLGTVFHDEMIANMGQNVFAAYFCFAEFTDIE